MWVPSVIEGGTHTETVVAISTTTWKFLNTIYLIHRYPVIKKTSPAERAQMVVRTILTGGKAAPSYVDAKIIIELTGNIGEVANNDPGVSPYPKVAFVPNYSATVARMPPRVLRRTSSTARLTSVQSSMFAACSRFSSARVATRRTA